LVVGAERTYIQRIVTARSRSAATSFALQSEIDLRENYGEPFSAQAYGHLGHIELASNVRERKTRDDAPEKDVNVAPAALIVDRGERGEQDTRIIKPCVCVC
jgi:hypothetical protein